MISQNYANSLLNVIVGTAEIKRASAVYLGLCDQEPNAINGAIKGEPEADSYKRVRVSYYTTTNSASVFGSASGGIVTNTEEIKFNVAREAFGTMLYWFLSQSETGNAIIWGTINGGVGLTIGAQSVPVFYENELKASIDVALT